MTVNVALLTSEALVLGCDSIASATRFLVDPFRCELARDSDGEPLKDRDGNLLIPFNIKSGEHYVTDTVHGVTKMFKIYDRDDAICSAVTSGMGALNGRPMRTYADEYCINRAKVLEPLMSISEIACDFLSFMRDKYLAHYTTTAKEIPEEYWSELEFLIGGFGADEQTPSLYRISVKNDSCEPYLHDSPSAPGVAWGGQSDGVERLIRGVDSQLQEMINRSIAAHVEEYRATLLDAVPQIVTEALRRSRCRVPNDFGFDLPSWNAPDLPWGAVETPIDYANIPIQDAVHFVAFLVNAQSWVQRFARGIATVGGRTHIGILRRGNREAFQMLNEPEVVHQFTGFDYA